MNRLKQGVFRIDGYVIDTNQRLILAAGSEVEIQTRAFDVLVYLLENRDRAVSKEELQDAVWPGQFISETVMSRAVMKVRKAIGDDSNSQMVIKTLHGYGYQFVAELKLSEKTPQPNIQDLHLEGSSNFGLSTAGDRPKSYFLISRRSVAFMIIIVATVLIWLTRDSLNSLYTGYVATGTPLKVTVDSWPEADMLFHRDARWLGGLVSLSVDLGGGRVAWFFENSYVSEAPGRSRADATNINNAVGIQRGYFAPTASLDVFWQTRDSAPASFFTEEDEYWYWPIEAVLVDSGLLVFLQETLSSSEGLGFQATRIVVNLVENPGEPPDHWVLKPLQLTKTDADMLINMAAVYTEGKYLYAFNRTEPGGDTYVARWLQEETGFENLLSTEWWCGEELGWLALGNDLSKARPAISDAGYAFTIQFLPEQNRYVLIEGWGFPSAVLSMRSANTLTSTWSERTIIYRPEERRHSGSNVQNIGTHPGLQGADITATYNLNHEIDGESIKNNSLLYPRFVRINFMSGK